MIPDNDTEIAIGEGVPGQQDANMNRRDSSGSGGLNSRSQCETSSQPDPAEVVNLWERETNGCHHLVLVWKRNNVSRETSSIRWMKFKKVYCVTVKDFYVWAVTQKQKRHHPVIKD